PARRPRPARGRLERHRQQERRTDLPHVTLVDTRYTPPRRGEAIGATHERSRKWKRRLAGAKRRFMGGNCGRPTNSSVVLAVVIAHGFGSHEPVPMGVPFSFAHSAVLSCSHSAWLSSLSFSPSELSPLSSAMQHRTMSVDVGGGQGSGSQLLAMTTTPFSAAQ